jgi:hypothetical protein
MSTVGKDLYAMLKQYDCYYVDEKFDHRLTEQYLTKAASILEVGAGRS